MLPKSDWHVANNVAKLGSDVANYVAKSKLQRVGWQHPLPVLNTKQAFPAVFRLSLSVYGTNWYLWYERGLLNPPIANGLR